MDNITPSFTEVILSYTMSVKMVRLDQNHLQTTYSNIFFKMFVFWLNFQWNLFLRPSNSLWTSDAIWWHIFLSTSAQVMVCCLTGIIKGFPWHSSESNFQELFMSSDTTLLKSIPHLPGDNIFRTDLSRSHLAGYKGNRRNEHYYDW